jgi:chromosome partitioning protein
MGYLIGVVSQKGGVGKTTIARLLACHYAKNDWDVTIADFDTLQSTATKWASKRAHANLTPHIKVQPLNDVTIAKKEAEKCDVLIMDGAPFSSRQTLQIANAADFVLIPTSTMEEDLEPAVLLARDLTKQGIPKKRLAFILSRTGPSEVEEVEARGYIEEAGFSCLEGQTPQKDSYHQALAKGRDLTETPFLTVNVSAKELAKNMDTAIAAAINGRTKA